MCYCDPRIRKIQCERAGCIPPEISQINNKCTPNPIAGTFITCQAGNGEFVVKIQCENLKQSHEIHKFLIESFGG